MDARFRFRPDTFDQSIFQSVVLENEYQLPDRLDGADVVIDVGAHIGSFAYACLTRGAGKVLCFETEAQNFQLCREHLAPFGARAEVHRLAVSRSDRPLARLDYTPPEDPANTGGGGVMSAPNSRSQTVGAIAFDEIAREAGRCRFLKLDCEGSEYPILYTSKELGRVTELAGEFHHLLNEAPLAPALDVGFPFRVEVLCDHLESLGMRTRHHYVHRDLRGSFFARWDRPPIAP